MSTWPSVATWTETQLEAGVAPADAVRSLLGREGPRPDGDVGDELVRYDGGKHELDARLNQPCTR